MNYKLLFILSILFFLNGCSQNELKITIVSSSTHSTKINEYPGLLLISNNKYTYYRGEVKIATSIIYSIDKRKENLFLNGNKIDFIESKEYVIEGITYTVKKYKYLEPNISDSMKTYYFVEKIGLILIHSEMKNIFIYSPHSNKIIKTLIEDVTGFSEINIPPPVSN